MPGEDEEIQWQDRVSSGFDRLVAFATELNKNRRSMEDGDSDRMSPKREDDGRGHQNIYDNYKQQPSHNMKKDKMKVDKQQDNHRAMEMSAYAVDMQNEAERRRAMLMLGDNRKNKQHHMDQ